MDSNQGEEDQNNMQKLQEEQDGLVEQQKELPLRSINQQENQQAQIQNQQSGLNNQLEENKEDIIEKCFDEEEFKQDQKDLENNSFQDEKYKKRTITIKDQDLQDFSQMDQSQVDQSLSSMNNNSDSQIQDQNQQVSNQQQQQYLQQQQIEQEEEEENNNPLNPAELYARMIGTMNNEPFLNEETLIGIYELLHLNSPEMFDEIDRNQPNWKEQVELVLKKRLEIYNKKVELISNIYQQNIPNNSMHNIEKIMSIIKSKEKEIYIYKIDKNLPLCCKHHPQRNNDDNQNQQDQEQKNNDFDSNQDQINGVRQTSEQQIEQSNQQDQQENIICQDKQCEDFNHNHIKGQNEIEDDDPSREVKQEQYEFLESNTNQKNDQNGNLEELIQKEEGENLEEEEEEEYEIIDDKDDDISEENLEKLKKKLERNENIRKKQEEQKKRLIEENQRLKREYEEMVEKDQKLRRDYQNQLQVENYLLSKEATLQVQFQQLQNLQQHNQNNLSDSQQNQNLAISDNEQLEQNNQNFIQKAEQIDESPQIQSNSQSENQPDLQTNQIQSEDSHHSHHHHDQHNHNHQHHHHNHYHHHHNNHAVEENQNQNHSLNNEQQESTNPAFQHSEEYNQNILPYKILGQSLSINHIHSIMSMQFVDLQRLKSLNPVENSITFEMNENYLIKIKSCEQIKYDKSSLCSKIPHFIFKEHIFPFLSSVELFRVRSVSPEWRELVREVWHKTFKRDMQEQLLATDLCKEIEAQFKLMHIRNPFFQKLNILIRAMVEVINWDEFEKKCLENKLNQSEKKILVSLLRIIGYNILDYENINQFEEQEYNSHQVDIALHLKDFLTNSINNNGMSSQSLKNIYNNFLVQADISMSMIRNESDKNFIIFILIAKQYFLYSLLRNYITSSSIYMQLAKNKLDALSKDWPTSKGFLEGAYRILLLRNVSIKNGQIVNNDSDDGDEFKINRKNKKTKKSKKMDKNKKAEQVNENNQGEVNNQQSLQQQDRSETQNVIENNTDLKQINQEENKSTNFQNNIEMTQEESQIEQSQINDQKEEKQENINNEEEEETEDVDNNDDEEEDDGDQEQSQAELAQLMNSIFNLQQKENQEPDIVIKRKAGTMKIFLDQGTKLDIILNTVITFGMETAHKKVAQEACNLVQNSKVTLERLEKTFNENQQQIDEMKIKSQQLEQSLLQKQAELEKVQLQNQQLQQEFQKDSQEIQQLQNTVRKQEDEIENYESTQSMEIKDKDQENNQNIDKSDQQPN